MKTNPMLRALDHKIADIIRQRAALEGQLEVLKATRAELAGLVRKRAKAAAIKPAEQPGTAAA